MKKVHITLLGKETLPIYYLVKTENYDKVFFLATEQTKLLAKRLKEVLASENIVCEVAVVDAFDAITTINACEQIHKELEVGGEVTYNITGGTKLMAIGAYIAAQRHGAKVVYTNSDSLIDLSTFESQPLNIEVDSKTIFALQGQILKEGYIVYQENKERHQCATKIKAFLTTWKWRKFYDKVRTMHEKGCLYGRYAEGNLSYEYFDDSVTITANGKTVLDISCPKVRQLLFEGRWWEELVANAIYKWADGRFEVWQNVTFTPQSAAPTGNKVKNEIDILVNTGNKMLFVECKSGLITQDNINKIGVIRTNYGSDKSVSVLISFNAIRPDLCEKAHELKVNVIAGKEKKTAQGGIYAAPLDTNSIAGQLDKVLAKINA